MSVLPKFNRPLPQTDGPKLHPFPGRKKPINFVRALSDINADGQSHVFEVSIGSKKYALKMFKFYDDEMDRAGLVTKEHNLVSNDLLHAHMDPFFNECRAYGRLIEASQNDKIAVRCYGHMSIPADKEEELSQKFNIQAWDRPGEEYAKPASRRQPFRAVVKDLIQEPVQLTQMVIKKMRELGVFPMDVCARNYEGGLLVDMSIAMTTSHFLFKIRPRWQVRVMQREDLLMFDRMIQDEEVNTWVRALPNRKFCAKLRSQAQRDGVPKKQIEGVLPV